MRVSKPSLAIAVGSVLLLCVLAILHVPGAAIALVGATLTLLNWVTQGPEGKNGQSLLPPKPDRSTFDPRSTLTDAPQLVPPPKEPK